VDQCRRDAVLDAHLGLQRVPERACEIAAGIVDGGVRQMHNDGVDGADIVDLLGDADRGLAGSLGKIAGRNRLVVDRHDLFAAVRE
jgi:hypothetical protein